MELNLNPWQRFLVVSSVLAIGIAFLVSHGGLSWYLAQYSDLVTIWSSCIIVAIIMLIFIFQGGVGAYRIQLEQRALRALREQGFQAIIPHSHLSQVLTHVQDCMSIQSNRKMKVDPFVDHFETLLYKPIKGLEQGKELLITIGILGTVFGILYGLASGDASALVTAEAVQQYSVNALQGVSVSYITTLIALFGALIVYYLRIGYQSVADQMVSEFGVLLERELLQVNKVGED